MGFTASRLELIPGRPNLIVTVGSSNGPHLGLSGHLDTKPVGDARDQWFTDPFELSIKDGQAYGLGSTDMKGAVAAMLVALQRHTAKGLDGRVSLVLTADEEQGSNAGAKVLAERAAVDVDALIIGEPSGVERSWEMMALVSRGICCFEITVRTQQGHSGLSSRLGRNAVLVATDALRAMEVFQPPIAAPGAVPAAPTMNSGIFTRGGVSFGTSPGECVIGCEIRLIPGMERDEVQAAIDRTVTEAIGDQGTFEINYLEGSLGWMPAVELNPAEPVVEAAQAACRAVLGRSLPIQAYPGGTDATYFMGVAGIPTIASLGPGLLSVAHGPNESVPVADLHTAVDLYEHLMGEYADRAEGSRP